MVAYSTFKQPSTTWIRVALVLAFVLSVGVHAAAEAKIEEKTPTYSSDPSWDDILKTLTLQLGGTVEVLFRSFCLGFGAHMLQYLLIKNNDATYEDLKGRFRVSAVCGLAMACFVFGSSMFVPTQFRLGWFEY
jgi:hypothetical protein